MSLTILVPKVWRRVDHLLAQKFPRRRATVAGAVWLDELLAKRFGAAIVCQPCWWKGAGAALARFGYAKHPDIKSQGGRCDVCQQTYSLLPIWIAEEKRGRAEVTRRHLDIEHQRRLAPVPELFRA